jgi:uroporphyrin-III C-methyltransferase/precorrin-2 dehydrogenase/sirohydrochlorin ferrochelatase
MAATLRRVRALAARIYDALDTRTAHRGAVLMDRARIPSYALRPLAAGEVALVGTGPGDPELLTLRALRMIEQADVVLYDHLVSDDVMALVPPRVERIYVGKQCSNHAMRQDAINALMVELARLRKRVVRLKGGDPFIFGRGGEEIETLADHGIAFQVVPGITAASGVSAYAGIPLTHRDHAHAVVFVTGHRKDDDDLDWDALARGGQTIVCYMGSRGLERFCAELAAHGLAPATPAAIVSHGTRATQRVVTATLATLAAAANAAALEPPTLVIVGDVVRLRERLAWFERPVDATVAS